MQCQLLIDAILFCFPPPSLTAAPSSPPVPMEASSRQECRKSRQVSLNTGDEVATGGRVNCLGKNYLYSLSDMIWKCCGSLSVESNSALNNTLSRPLFTSFGSDNTR